MSNCCKKSVEPCHTSECSGLEEVVALLPHGSIWNVSNGSTFAQYAKALGHVKTELNKRICQEFNEMNPCKSVRLFEYWARLYKLPECVDQTPEKLCEWLDIIYDRSCPIGSVGFLRKAIEFVAPDLTFQIEVNYPDGFGHCWCGDNVCVDENPIVITVDSDDLHYEMVGVDRPSEAQDGVDPCKTYFVPEIQCLRDTVFPYGLGVGFKTTVPGPNGEPIHGVSNQSINPYKPYTCFKEPC